MKGPQSIRGKVTLATTLVTTVAMLVILLFTAQTTHTVLQQNIIDTLNTHIDIVQAELEIGHTNLSIEGTGSELIQVIDEDGEVVATSNWAQGISPISKGGLTAGETIQSEIEQMTFSHIPREDGTAYHVSVVPKDSSSSTISATALLGQEGPFVVLERGVQIDDDAMTIVAMASIKSANDASFVITGLLAAIMLLSLVGIAALSWTLASRTLRPVSEMRAMAETINAGDLSKRIPVPENDQDLSKLAETFNTMLGRVEKSMIEQKRFISDASHERKSPVAATRIMLETAIAHPDAVDLEVLGKDLVYENERMQSIVSDLLLLAQDDEGKPRIEKHPIDLYDILIEEVTALANRTDVGIDTSGVMPVVCKADAIAIRHAVRNMLDNAARYTKNIIKLSCCEQDDTVRIVVSDDGPGIPEEDRERVFGRFVRLEEGRSRKEGSTGLGLAVVRTIAKQHGGSAQFIDPECGGASIEMVFGVQERQLPCSTNKAASRFS